MLMRMAVRALLLAALVLLLPACGSGGGGAVIVAGPGLLVIDSAGGASRGVSAGPGDSFGGTGGTLTVFSGGDITTGSAPAPLAPPLPTPPTTGLSVTSLAADVVHAGDILVSGSITSDTSAPVRNITSLTGDVVISGTITMGDPGAVKPVNLSISAPTGTVYLTGTINLVNTDGTLGGDGGADLSIQAARIVFAGTVRADGEDNPSGPGGPGGTVTLTTVAPATDVLMIGGSIDTTPGASTGVAPGDVGRVGGVVSVTTGGAIRVHGTRITNRGGVITSPADRPVGGAGGAITLLAPAGVVFDGTVVSDGGWARSTGAAKGAGGGRGGDLNINTIIFGITGPVQLFGSIRQRGGDSFAADTSGASLNGSGGRGGFIQIGAAATHFPRGVDLGSGPWTMNGGDSVDCGGRGGTIDLTVLAGSPGSILLKDPIFCSSGMGVRGSNGGGTFNCTTRRGDILLQAPLTGRGQDSNGEAVFNGGDGAIVTLTAGAGVAGDTGSVIIGAPMDCTGGSRTGALPALGGSGGQLNISANSLTGTIVLLSQAAVTLNGGRGTGGLSGGGGGLVTLITRDESILLGSNISAMGGAGGATSLGGMGGRLIARSDSNNDDIAGSITIAVGVTVDLSAGTGATGGSARASGVPGMPSDATAAVVLAADGEPAGAGDNVGDGVIVNAGTIIAKGGSSSTPGGAAGHGGDVMFSGRANPGGGVPLLGAFDNGPGAVGIGGTSGSTATE